MPVIIESATSYAFNTGAVEEKIHANIPMSAVDAIAAAESRVRAVADVCAVIKGALGANADDLVFTVAIPPAPVANQ